MHLLKSYTGRSIQCRCGAEHKITTREIIGGAGAIQKLPELLVNCGITGRGLVVGDENTFSAAGAEVCKLLSDGLRPYERLTLRPRRGAARVSVDVETLRVLRTRLKGNFQWALALGSGSINDLVKIAATRENIPYIAVATAVSMDGFLSANAGCLRNRVKEQIANLHAPLGVIADNCILRAAPEELTRAGLGDALGKAVSLTEWRLNAALTGEPYCERIAKMVRTELNELIRVALESNFQSDDFFDSLLRMVLTGGAAMQMLGLPAPSTGGEHWVSHAVVMMGCAKHGNVESSHGMEVAAGSWLLLLRYRKLFGSRSRRPLKIRAWENYQAQLESWRRLGIDMTAAAERKHKMCEIAAEHLGEMENAQLKRTIGSLLELYGDLGRIYRKFHLPKSLMEIGLTADEAEYAITQSPLVRPRISAWDLER